MQMRLNFVKGKENKTALYRVCCLRHGGSCRSSIFFFQNWKERNEYHEKERMKTNEINKIPDETTPDTAAYSIHRGWWCKKKERKKAGLERTYLHYIPTHTPDQMGRGEAIAHDELPSIYATLLSGYAVLDIRYRRRNLDESRGNSVARAWWCIKMDAG